MPNGTTLKQFILKFYAGTTANSVEAESRQLGKSLGSWLRGFAEWSASQPELRPIVAENIEAKQVRHMLNFLWLSERVKEYPAILDHAKNIFVEVENAANTEMEDESKLQIIHGDFWTGKWAHIWQLNTMGCTEYWFFPFSILLPNAPILEGRDVPVFVIDWEMAHLGVPNVDFGQMIAEMYTTWLFKSIPSGLWMMESLVYAYGEVTEEFAFRTAIQVGTHLVCVISTLGWGPPEQVEKAIVIGRDIIVHAWNKDRSWFEKGELACIFSQVVSVWSIWIYSISHGTPGAFG